MPAPALLLYGPSGSGKTEICCALLKKTNPYTHARVSCDTFKTSKQLIRAIWLEISFVKYKFDNRYTKKGVKFKNNAFRDSLAAMRTPSTYGSLAEELGPLLDSFLGCQTSFYDTRYVDDETFGISAPGAKVKDEEAEGSHYFGYSPCDGKKRQGVFYLYLDRIDFIEQLERDLTNSLLCLSEVISLSRLYNRYLLNRYY